MTLMILSLSLPVLATIRTQNCNSYGPSKDNIVVTIDDEDETKVMAVGHETMGIFFAMNVRGCRLLQINRNQLICEGRVLGPLSPIRREMEDDMLTNGLRANLLFESSYEVTGSCVARDRKPLTITFK